MFNPLSAQRLRLHADALPRDAQVLSFSGSEGIGTLYSFDIQLVSENLSVALEALLGQPAFLAFDADGRGIHGVLAEARQGAIGTRLAHYQVRLVPHMARLALRHNYRIFQQRSVAQIVAQLLEEHGLLADAFAFQLEADYPPRDYCVQYGESDLVFVERLCQEEGIHYRFEHAPGGHRVLFSDHQMHFPHLPASLDFVPGNGMHADGPVVSAFAMTVQRSVEQVMLRDHDFRKASVELAHASRAGDAPALEHYAYPGGLLQTLDQARGRVQAQRALERCRVGRCRADGSSDAPALASGRLLTLTGHPLQACNQMWLVTQVTHTGHQPQVLEEQAGAPESDQYANTFSAIPWDATFRSALIHPKPRAPSSQQARVTGPAGEEVYCDAFGRVKVQFPWDREGQGDEHSSCWLRVASGWAGDGHGALAIPRVGMAVLVSFLDDDPDQPVISGCLPDSLHMSPYNLPEHHSRTVLRSRSLGGGGGYNELAMDDRGGQELFYLRAQRDLQQRVERNSQLYIGGLQQAVVVGERKTLLHASDHLTVEQASHTKVGTLLLQHAGQRVQISADGDVLVEGGNSITLKVAGQHLLVNAGGIFTSSPIQLGGAPATSLANAPSLPPAPSQLALLKASQAAGSDYCPLCQSCRDGQCLPAGGGQ